MESKSKNSKGVQQADKDGAVRKKSPAGEVSLPSISRRGRPKGKDLSLLQWVASTLHTRVCTHVSQYT